MDKEKVITRLRKIISEETNLTPDKIESGMSSVISVLQMCNYNKDNEHISQIQRMKRDVKFFTNKNISGFKVYKTFNELKDAFINLVEVLIEEKNEMGLPEHKIEKSPGVSLTVTQHQNQTQEIAISIYLESIKDELTGRQMNEIKEILKEIKDIKDISIAKPQVIEKLKSFGGDVLSNIIANIITNPTILASF